MKPTLAERCAADAKAIYREITGNGQCPRHAVCSKSRDTGKCAACQSKAHGAIAKILERNIRLIVKEALA